VYHIVSHARRSKRIWRPQIRCVGLAGKDPSVPKQAADEMLILDAEREVFFGAEVARYSVSAGSAEPSQLGFRAAMAVTMADRNVRARRPIWITHPRREPERHEIEIEVAATGLNFRDVMWNLRLLPEEERSKTAIQVQAWAWGKCAGTVARGRCEVTTVKVGSSHRFCAACLWPATWLRLRLRLRLLPGPGGIAFEAASTITVAFLTLLLSYIWGSGARPGRARAQSAGGVGLAP